MNNKKLVHAQIQRSQLAVVGMNNVSVIDTRVSKLNNDYQDFIHILTHLDTNMPIFGSAVLAREASPATVLALGAAGITTRDKIVVFALPNSFNAAAVSQAIAGILISEKYMRFNQGGVHNVEIIPMFGNQPDEINRRALIVEPTSGVNSVSEYVVLPTQQPLTLGPVREVAAFGGTVPYSPVYSKSAGNYLTPWPLGRLDAAPEGKEYSMIIVAFKEAALDTENQYSVSPIFAGIIASHMIADILNS